MTAASASASAHGAGVPATAPTSSGGGATAQAARTAHDAPRVKYVGVERSPGGSTWAAHVLDPDNKGKVLAVGAFADEHAAALAHDRLSLAYHGDAARLNFRPAFHGMEHQFLRRCRMRAPHIDLRGIVEDGTYEARYATFLRAVYRLDDWRDYMDAMLEFFIDRAAEIGAAALEDGGERLAARFVEMHRNRAVDPAWRAWYHRRVAHFAEVRRRQLRGASGGGGRPAAVRPQCVEQQGSNNSGSSLVLSRG
ncbi:hypothetical protein ACP4OV_005280 [Aristida adscensionis]